MTTDPELVFSWKHRYRSTACFHSKHDQCRLTCKFCEEPCACQCHLDVVAHAPDGQVKVVHDAEHP